MKFKKIIYVVIFFVLFIILGTLNVNAAQEINTVNDMALALGPKNIEVNENQIKLLNNIELKDNLIIKNGNYIIDLNGKTISYTKNYATPIYMFGGSLTIKDETNNGALISMDSTISCYKGFLKIENCKVISKEAGLSSLSISNDALVQIDNGEFNGTVVISEGSLIINGGLFKNGLEVIFEPFTYEQPTVIVNDGEFHGNHAGLYIMFSYYAKNVQLKGGAFKGANEETPGIYVGDKFDLKDLLPRGYKFDNDEQNFIEIDNEYVSYSYTGSANSVSVQRNTDRNLIKLIFVDYDGNVIETKDVVEGSNFTLPEAPKKEGYVFAGWNIDSKNITNDTVVTPIYEKISNFKIDVIYDAYYTGKEIKPNVVVIDEITKKRLSEEDYEIICKNNINAGTVDFVVQGKGKYKYCTQVDQFKILPKTIYYDGELKVEKDFEYTGEEIKPNITLMYNGIELINGVDYKVQYESNINVGYGRITVSGIGNYTGEKTEFFKIDPKEINVVTLNETNFLYTGNEIIPEVIVKAKNKELAKNIDYTLYYSNNINVGTGIIRINGIGNYSGHITKEFNIVSKNIEDVDIKIDLSNKYYTGRSIKPNVELTDNNYKLKENFDYKVEYLNNVKIGKATIKITGKNGYVGTIIKTFNIVPDTIKIKSIKTSIFRTVKLTWQKDSSIDGYEIFRSNNKNGNYSLVKTINQNNKDNYTFLAHKKGTYYYTIKSYKIVDGNKIYSDFSDVKEIKVK